MILQNLFKPKIAEIRGNSLYDIVKSPKRDMFPPNYFPFMEKTASGIFIRPRSKVISSNERYFVKYLVIRNCGAIMKVCNDHNYPMVELPKDGFIAKFRIDFVSIADRGFSLDYFINYNDVTISENVEKSLTRSQNKNGENVDLIEEDKTVFGLVDDPNKSFIMQLVQQPNFFDTYLIDAIDDDGVIMSDIDYLNQMGRNRGR